ncbi:UNVERIFIED_CONTAM: hypothetical protein Sangu_1713400 [Sesamum angustifolium]|uniref:Integrase catalytic domain-containing protein n=1 Tax=Sesamum angustifolium TaxID=2727405 RepID=A0AAW2MJJ8_9LAMI
MGKGKRKMGTQQQSRANVYVPTALRNGIRNSLPSKIWHARLGHISPDRIKRYKSDAFVRFKEFKLEVENQTGRKIKTFRSDRGGEYLSGEILNHLKKNGIVSQWTRAGIPQLNGVAERRNKTLLDMVRSMMSFTELALSFWGYVLEAATRSLNIAPSKTVVQTPYQIWT